MLQAVDRTRPKRQDPWRSSRRSPSLAGWVQHWCRIALGAASRCRRSSWIDCRSRPHLRHRNRRLRWRSSSADEGVEVQQSLLQSVEEQLEQRAPAVIAHAAKHARAMATR